MEDKILGLNCPLLSVNARFSPVLSGSVRSRGFLLRSLDNILEKNGKCAILYAVLIFNNKGQFNGYSNMDSTGTRLSSGTRIL